MRLAIFTSGRATRFRKMLELHKDFEDSVQLIYTDDPSTFSLFKQQGAEPVLDDWRSGNKERKKERHKSFSDHLLQLLEQREIDYLFCNGTTLLEGAILSIYKNRIVTFHAGLLPQYAGWAPLERMKENEEFLMGTAAIFVDETVDRGSIIMESVIPGKIVMEEGFDILLETQLEVIYKVFRLLGAGRISVNEDGKVSIEGADYRKYQVFPYIEEDE